MRGEAVKAELKVKAALSRGRCKSVPHGQQLSVTLLSAAQELRSRGGIPRVTGEEEILCFP